MTVDQTYPGVYVQELPSGVRPIAGVPTSITAFIGRASRGPVNETTRVQSIVEYTRVFGELWLESTMSYAVRHFFQHGGTDALIVRVFNGDLATNSATLTLSTASGSLVLEAASPGRWGSSLQVIVDHDTRDTTDPLLFNLTVAELEAPGSTDPVAVEIFPNVSVDPASDRFVNDVIDGTSGLVRVRSSAPENESPVDAVISAVGAATDDGSPISDAEITGDQAAGTGIFALDSADLFNLLCIPPLERDRDLAGPTWAAAASYCQDRRAMLIVDSPAAWTATPSTTIADAETGVNDLRAAIGTDDAINAMAYFPRLRMDDPLTEDQPSDFAPCGAIAGIIARNDVQRGVWRAAAGLDTSFSGVQGLTHTMTDAQNGVLNPLGLNCLRTFSIYGNVVWGARTLAGADQLASEWKYIPVRRVALFIEESLFRGTQWVVFEPNDESLWAQIRLNVGAFMEGLFRQGAFQGATPSDAYFVKCDAETTTQNDIDQGVVNVVVGFAPLIPAEFVVITIAQIADPA